MLMLSII